MNSAWTRAVVVILSVFVILVAVGQVFFTDKSSVVTETAYNYGYDEEIPFTGVFLRDETAVINSDTGVLSYEFDDGIKVGQNTVVARRYKSDADIAYRNEINRLKKHIEMLETAEQLVGTDSSQLEAISAQINESHSEIISNILAGNYAAASEKRNNLLCAMCKQEITLEESDGYAVKKSLLTSRINELEKMLSGGVKEVFAGGAGYFVSSVDGYEGELGYDSIDGLTAELISSVTETPVKGGEINAIGKLIADYRWRAAAVIDRKQMPGIYEGAEVTLRIGSSPRLLKTKVVSVRPCGDEKAIYVFECDNLVSEAVSSRTASFKLVVNSYGGLRVSRKALKYNDSGDSGVYILRGQTLVFKKVEVLYWGEDYVICERRDDDEEYVKMYDLIVVEGKDLYDGKVV